MPSPPRARHTPFGGVVSRRQALATLGCISCSLLFGGAAPQRGGRPAAPRAARGTIDVHSHFFPPSLEELSKQTLAALGQAAPVWSPALAVEAMDRNGVAKSVVGASWRPALLQLDRDKRRAIARDANE